MALVLAIEPDLRQAAILKRILKEKVKADLVVVDTRDAAIEAIGRGVPDVVLLSALLSPRDEDELIQHLRSLEDSDHLQTHTIPQLSSSLEDRAQSKGRGLLKAFRRKKEPEATSGGCDPDLFADEIKTFIKCAAEKKEERRALAESGRLAAKAPARIAMPAPAEPEQPEESGSTWDDPFAWPSASTSGPRPTTNSQVPIPNGEYPSSNYATPKAIPANTKTEEEELPTSDHTPPKEVAKVAEPVQAEPEVEQPIAAAAPEPVVSAEPHDAWATDYRPASPVIAQPTPDTQVATPNSQAPTPNSQVPTPEDDAEIAEVVGASVSGRSITVPKVVEPAELPTPNDQLPTASEAAEPEVREPEPMVASEPELEPVAAAASQPTTPRSLGPLATWVRFEAQKAAPQTTSDELRELMAHLSIPPQVAGVAYARGCRIRRVRVPGGRERRKGDASGPVILSRKQLAAQREANISQ